MRIGTLHEAGGATTAAALDDDGTWRRLRAADCSALVADVLGANLELGDVVSGTPGLPLPAPSKVICCGLNYADHITETGRDLPSHPTLFAKYADTLVGPQDDIILPGGLDVDWEAELAVVVGAEIRNADRDEAAEAIFGYTVANDISIRDWQYRTLQWFQGKAWDRSTPVGPVIVTADSVDPTEGLAISCSVNGEEMQSASTRTLVFDAADLLAYVSTFTVLRPGDLVLTGTPGGVGVGMDPKRYLADGDVVETRIDGIGSLRNIIRFHS